jgi:Ca2+-binding EF-hand superfamily protein
VEKLKEAEEMLTELQIRKLTVLFQHHDLDNDGYLARADYEEYARRMCEALDLAPGSPQCDAVYAQTLAAWDTEVLRAFDTDGDNRVSLEEHLAAYDVSINDPVLRKRLQQDYADSMVKLWDRDGDGRLSDTDYVALLGCYGVPEEAARQAFRHLDRDGDGYLLAEELLKAVEEFHLSDDPDAPGNWLVGPY